MLQTLREGFGPLTFVGLEMSRELLLANHDHSIGKLQGDALSLPIRPGSADAVVATAVLEHVEDPNRMLAETFRALRPGGVLVLTTPEPTLERMSAALGLLKEAGHSYTFNLRQLRQIVAEAGFVVVEARRFMFSPIGFPAEKLFERIFGPLGLKLLMANQLVVARKT
jgi:ubiquinone/menaquinone biosynthesis C-methylase UbiE